MTNQPFPASTLRRRLGVLLATVCVVGLLAAFWWPNLTHAAGHLTNSATDPVTVAWQKAKAAGSYHFTSDVLQKTIPVASLTNVGRSSHTDALHLEGQNDLRNQALELTLWNQGGSVLNAASGVSMRTEKGKTFTRRGNEAWQETDNQTDAFAPQGDFLGYLAAIRNVGPGVHETRNGVSFTRYTFALDGPAFANYMHEQLTAAMRAKGELPASAQLDPPAYYRDMTGDGELWIGANGLPLRQLLNLHFPEQNEERVEANMTVDFAKYGAEQTGLLTLLRTGQWQGAWLVLPQRLPDFTPLWLALLVSALAVLVLVYRQRRAVYVAIVTAVIFAQVAGPLLNTLTQVKFFDTYRAKAAAQAEQQAADRSQRDLQTKMNSAPAFNPHQNPRTSAEFEMRNAESTASTQGQNLEAVTVQQNSALQIPQSAVVDPGTDTDGDGLTDFTEVRIDTSEVISDTDDDSLPDNLEVNGFTMGGQTWYTDPNAQDSNGDGLGDLQEWGLDSAGNLRTTPLDTDGDGLPDLFDPDNDNDGVPDRLDLAPFVKGAVTYNEATPLQFSVNNLTPNQPTFVEFQIRPQDPKNLWFAQNVLDWPQDSEGQVRDVDGKTYANFAAAQGRAADADAANGDMKVIPMLEIRIPKASANLPDQAELTPFSISVNDFTTDGQTKVAYVPLSIITDDKTGERVAFSGEMRYKPTGSWTTPHSVRLAWLVQALNDLPCDPKNAADVAKGCQTDGYIHNQPTVLHGYYDSWTLTGLTVREDHGASMGIVYEDPTVDDNKKEDAGLWALALVLDHHFLIGRDENTDGVRDLKVSDLASRFDRDNNPSETQRFAVPNLLQVTTNSYTTGDEATAATAMTETNKILNTVFKPVVTADNAVKPLLLFAEENSLRVVGLDQVGAGENYATQSGARVTLDLAPTPQSALSVTVNAALKWMAYCGANGNTVTWRPCTADEYAGALEGRYANLPSQPGDGPNDVAGRMMLTQAYYFSLITGYGATVQEGTRIISSRYSQEGDNQTAARVRIGLNTLLPVPVLATQNYLRMFLIAREDLKTGTFSGALKKSIETLGTSYKQLKAGDARLEANEDLSNGNAKEVKLTQAGKFKVKLARLTAVSIAGGAIMVVTTALGLSPDLDTTARSVLGAIGATAALLTTLIVPIAQIHSVYKLESNPGVSTDKPGRSLSAILSKTTIKTTVAKIGAGVGLALSVALIWGFFIYGAASSGYTAGSPALNKAFFEAVAATLVAVLLAVLSATLIGSILVAIVGFIDSILTLVCELGVDELRIQGSFYGGACFTVSTTLIKALSYLLYNYEPMINTSRNDLMVTGAPNLTLADPNKGYVPANALTLTLPVTTTVIHKDPDLNQGSIILVYLYLFSPENLRSSTFKYGLSKSGSAPIAVARDQMPGAWQDVREDHKFIQTPMYRGVARTDPAPLTSVPLVQGINSTVPFSLTMNFAVPAFECWTILIAVPVCYTRELQNSNTIPFTQLKYDVFPNTLTEFLALGSKPGGGLGQGWDAHLPALRDADGDGLANASSGGLDPNDATWDADGDGLSDFFELQRRTASVPYSPVQRDTDGDGLTDKQEAEISTDPAVADTDNDGLSDGVEIRHQVYDANGNLTTAWAGGWQVTINSTPARTLWVSSDPFHADSDQDGISDQAEKDLAVNPDPALRVDDQGVPYHPNVPNTPPLAVFAASNAFAGYIGPNQQLTYTTTVVANVPVEPGLLDVSVPASQNYTPAPLALPFNPLTFSGSQTVTQAINFTALPSGALGAIDLLSTARTRLQRSSGSPWVADPVAMGAPLGGFTAPFSARSSALTAARADRPDSYLLSSVTQSTNNISFGDVRGYNLNTGANPVLATSALSNNTSYFPRSSPGTDLSANSLGTSVAVWDQRDYCRTVTINSLKVVAAASDTGGGIEPFITIVTNDRTTSEQVWYWDAAGGAANMTAGQQRGPNGGGFPLTRTLCGLSDIQVWESDGPVNIPAQNTLVQSNEAVIGGDYSNFTMGFDDGNNRIELNINIPQEDLFTVAGARLNGDGAVQAPLSFPRPAISPTAKLQMFNPVVASDGDGFLALYEATIENSRGPRGTQRYLVAQAFDRNGVAGANSFRLIATPDFSTNFSTTLYDLAWIGDRYRVVWKAKDGATISSGDIDRNGAFTGTGWTTLVTDAATSQANALETPYTPQLAADPRSEQWILTYNLGSNSYTMVLLYPTRASTTASTSRILASANRTLQSTVAYNPINRGWLVGWYDGSDLVAYPLNLDLTNLVSLANGGPYFVLPTGSSYASNALACPLPQALPVNEFRFEELPTPSGLPTSFADSAGSGAPATCTGDSCPTAGVTGAPNAPLSDYGVRFDGVNDRLAVNRALTDDFTVAMWVKTAGQPTPGMLVDQGPTLTNGWGLYLNGSQLVFQGNQQISANANLSDNQWHFITVTRDRLNGTVAIYKDGALLTSGPHNTAVLNAQSQMWIGGNAANESNFAYKGDMDAVQFYATALSASTVQALYNRTIQSYCVGSGASFNGVDVRWGKLTLREKDLRGGRLTASGGLKVTVDNSAPLAQVTSVTNNAVVAPDQVIGGTASDNGIGVDKVEVSLNNGAWQPATGADTWTFSLAGLSGVVNIRVRATDLVGNVGAASAAINVTVDNTAPALTINAPAATLKPTKNAAGQWQVPVSGTASDSSGLKAAALLVKLTQTSGVGVAQTQQAATLTGNTWSLNYLLDPGLFDPTGAYTVTAQVDDNVGNRTTAAAQVVHLDASGPVAALSAVDGARTVITQAITIGGVISDTNSVVGLDKLEIAFTPIEQIAALPVGLTSDQAEAQLNRQWLPVTLAQRGAGVTQTTWSGAIPTGLENSYQIDLRGTDLLGNVSINSGAWRGIIDTRAPRVVMTATATGATYVNTADNTQRYEVRFVCAAQDRNLNEAAFTCPGKGLVEPVRSFDSIPALQALFPDLTLRTGLAISYTLWTTSTTPAAKVSACDSFGRCAQASTGAVVATRAATDSAAVTAAAVAAAPAPGAPMAVVINPTNNSFVAAGNALSVTVAAEAGAGLQNVTLKLDNATVQTLSFSQSPLITRTVRTINVPVASEGPHTLVAQATNWANATQTTLYPVSFTLDKNAPLVTIDPSAITLANTWVPESGVLRFHGNASDSGGLAAVQIREGNNGFTDATFGGGTWRVALPVTDPEGRTLNITVRAIDRAGRITQVNQAIATQLSAADAPDTRIIAGPTNPSTTNSASFVFTSTVSAFECSLDNGVYTPCASPKSYTDLSKGSHAFLVRAIDGRGLPDLSPATFTWSINASQPDANITGKPANPTTDRTATFTFTGDATATRIECSLDGSAYSACTSPKVYTNVGNGDHTFWVRARNSANVAGAADRYNWTVTNAAPVANNQSVVVVPNQAKKITLTATDSDPLLYTIVTPPTHGVLTGLPPNVTYAPNTNYGGVDSFTFKANDGLADSNLGTVTLFVDNVPPGVTCSATPNNLWPPNHKLANIQATVTVTDAQSGPAGFTLVSVTSSEADSGLGATDVPLDIQNWVAGTPDVAGQLRAERSDTGPGRIYTLTYRGKDVAGNTALCTTTVKVPKSQGGLVAATFDAGQTVDDPFVGPSPAVDTTPVVDTTPGTDAQPQRLFLPLITLDAASETVVSESVVTPTTPGITTTLPLTQTTLVTTTASAAQPDSPADNSVATQLYLPLVTTTTQ